MGSKSLPPQRSQSSCEASRSSSSAASCAACASRSRRASSSSDSSSRSSKSASAGGRLAAPRAGAAADPDAPVSRRSTRMRPPGGRTLEILPDCTCWYCNMLVPGSSIARQVLASAAAAPPLPPSASASAPSGCQGEKPLMGCVSSPWASLHARKPPATRTSSGSFGSGRPPFRLLLISCQFSARSVRSSPPMCAASQLPSLVRANSK
mmetsp:Transcript_113472/g.366612  ORF Transcript_113472/g.366612 Transcript_113472/m.366612 type:complete len:208 (+) Transcript_113472:98-721(+)